MAKGVEWTAKVWNMEALAKQDDLAIETELGVTCTVNTESNLITECDISTYTGVV